MNNDIDRDRFDFDFGAGREEKGTYGDVGLVDGLSVDRGQGGDEGGSDGSETHY